MIDGIDTNIKNLPAGNYFTEYLWTDRRVWREIRRTERTAVLERVEVGNDPDWKMESYPGGFARHVANNRSQTWLFHHLAPEHVRVRLTKKGWSHKGTKFVEGLAFHFYDFNF